MKLTLRLFILFFTLSAQAEYRVYRLGIKYNPSDKNEKEIEIISSLDDLQYDSYYRLTSQQETRLISHWMCWGRTDYQKPYCPEPKAPLPDKGSDVRSPAQVSPQQPTPNVIK